MAWYLRVPGLIPSTHVVSTAYMYVVHEHTFRQRVIWTYILARTHTRKKINK